MVDLHNRIVLVTGASSGIGRSCSEAFARLGCRVIVAARRLDRLEELLPHLREIGATDAYAVEIDVRDNASVERLNESIPEEWRDVEILVNNAGLSRGLDPIQHGSVQDWDEMIDTNIKGLLYVSRALLPGMVERGRGQVINIGSIAGHEVYPKGNVYCATKFAVGAITKGMQLDLHGTGVRVTTVDPGLVETEFSVVRFRGDEDRGATVYRDTIPLTPDDVAEAVIFCATRPPHVSVHELVLMPSVQASTTMLKRGIAR